MASRNTGRKTPVQGNQDRKRKKKEPQVDSKEVPVVESKKRSHANKESKNKKKVKLGNEYASVDDCLDKTERFGDGSLDADYTDILNELENSKLFHRKPDRVEKLFPAAHCASEEAYMLYLDLKQLLVEIDELKPPDDASSSAVETVERTKKQLKDHVCRSIDTLIQLSTKAVNERHLET